MSLSSCIYLQLNQGTGREKEFAFTLILISFPLMMCGQWVYFLVSVPFR